MVAPFVLAVLYNNARWLVDGLGENEVMISTLLEASFWSVMSKSLWC